MTDSLDIVFNSITPSAKSLLLTKAFTNIPFAKEAIEMIWQDKEVLRTFQDKISSLIFILRLIHFETRYWSIDEGLSMLDLKRILEFSSGYSFRGLDLCKDPEIQYIDTDLPQLIKNKELLINSLSKKYCSYSINNLILKDLNVLNGEAFSKIIFLFSPGPIAIVNEGLLVYLTDGQKSKLCHNIHNVLSQHGGFWITADIYVKKDEAFPHEAKIVDEKGKEFLEDHNVEENKFESFEMAEAFFADHGFKIYKKVDVPSSRVISRSLLKNIPRVLLEKLKDRKKTRETWMLMIA